MPSVFEKIMEFNKDRLPDMVQLKYGFISEDPFRFLRGTCHLFYQDLAASISWDDPTKAWISGDLHLENFGSYKGNNRIVYFDMNDFDESLLAPASWEVVRLLTSIFIAAEVVTFDASTAADLCKIYLDTYLHTLQNGKAITIERQTAQGLLKHFLEQVQLRKDRDFVKSRVTGKKNPMLIIDNVKTIKVSPENKATLIPLINNWFQQHEEFSGKFKLSDLAYRIAGTGSVGVERYVLLVYEKQENRFRLLDLKQAKPSSLQPYCSIKQPAWNNEAERVTALQRRIQYVSPAMLHVAELNNTAFVIKELQPTQDRMDLALCQGKLNKLNDILITMARLTASGQLRSTGRQRSSITDTLIDFGAGNNEWKKQVLQYAKQYAQQVKKDYLSYCKDYKKYIKPTGK